MQRLPFFSKSALGIQSIEKAYYFQWYGIFPHFFARILQKSDAGRTIDTIDLKGF